MKVNCKFAPGDILTHQKHPDSRYIVVGVPSEGWTIENTLELAYIYLPFSEHATIGLPRKWVRPQIEMEDGRFTKIS
jgi:hypothetical protein